MAFGPALRGTVLDDLAEDRVGNALEDGQSYSGVAVESGGAGGGWWSLPHKFP